MYDLKKSLEIFYPVFHEKVKSGHTFRFYEHSLLGVGPKRQPFGNLEELIKVQDIEVIYQEFFKALPHLPKKNLTPVSLIPEKILGFKCLDEVMLNLTEEDYKKLNLNGQEGLNDIKGIVHEKMGVPKGWEFVVHLRDYGPYQKRGEPSSWLHHASEHLPFLVKIVEALPFKSIGYCMILKVDPRYGTTLHRDSYVKNNDVHLMNIILNKKTLPFFVWDQKNNKKHYCPYKSFIFNEFDLHGSEPEDEPTYILRIDGKLKDEICQRFEFKNGHVWDESYYRNDSEKELKIYEE